MRRREHGPEHALKVQTDGQSGIPQGLRDFMKSKSASLQMNQVFPYYIKTSLFLKSWG